MWINNVHIFFHYFPDSLFLVIFNKIPFFSPEKTIFIQTPPFSAFSLQAIQVILHRSDTIRPV